MNLDDQAWPAMTYRDAIEKAFTDDWNSRRIVLEKFSENTTFITHVTIKIECPMIEASKALGDFMAKEKLK